MAAAGGAAAFDGGRRGRQWFLSLSLRRMTMAKAEVVSIPKAELERLQLLASKAQVQRSLTPGFRSMEPDSYTGRDGTLRSDLAKAQRVLDTGSIIEYKISANGWTSMTCDLVIPKKGGRMSPGIGGYLNRHRGYAAYFRSKDYLADLAWCAAHGAKDAPTA
jgi:hypothetical protein